jgi:hypothetical protein
MQALWGKVIKREARGIARELIEDPLYLEMLRRKLRSGKLHPQVQVMLWGYGYGKPVETHEVRQKATVRVVHEYAAGPVVPVGVGPAPELPDIEVAAEPLSLAAHE